MIQSWLVAHNWDVFVRNQAIIRSIAVVTPEGVARHVAAAWRRARHHG